MQFRKYVTRYLLGLFALFVGLFMPGIAAAETPEFIEGTTRITAEELIEHVQSDPDIVLIDARRAEDHATGFIEGSIGLPNYDTTPETLVEHIPSKDHAVIFYCNGVNCGRSVESAKIAVDAGYTNVFWFRGGWDEWMAKGLPATFE